MPHFPSLPADGTLMSVFERFPDTMGPIVGYIEMVMRGPGPFDPAERELIAAYVSGLNGCDYCHGVHGRVAHEFGVPEQTLAAALADLDSAPVDERLRPVLRYVGTLTRSPSEVTEQDAAAVYAAGWDEAALHQAVVLCALLNFMNRMVDGHGIAAGPEHYVSSGRRIHDIGYAGLAE